MTNEELISEYRKGDDSAIYRLYKQNMGMIRKAALKFSYYTEMEDLIQEAYFALVSAVETFFPDKDEPIKFSTWFMVILRRHYFKVVLKCSRAIRIPQYRMENILKLKDAEENLHDPEKVMAKLEWNQKTYDQAITDRMMLEAKSTEESIGGEDDDLTVLDTLEAEEKGFLEVENQEAYIELWKEVDKLPGDMPYIIRKRYSQGKSFKAISEDLKKSQSRVAEIHRKALRTLENSSELLQLARDEEIEVQGFRGTGLSAFRRTGTSATERAVFKLIEEEKKHRI